MFDNLKILIQNFNNNYAKYKANKILYKKSIKKLRRKENYDEY